MKRRLIYCADINPASVVLLFEKGNQGKSWSVRDYSNRGSVSLRRADQFTKTLPELLRDATYICDAPVVSTDDLDFWFSLIAETNERIETISSGRAELIASSPTKPEQSRQSADAYELIDAETLIGMPKWKKTHDVERMVSSPNSEDWVTWTTFRLMQRFAGETWWEHLASLALRDNPSISFPDGWRQIPDVTLWQTAASPSAYEKASRARMRGSTNPRWVERSSMPKPVEGDSEIDISIRSPVITVFVEAKLGSDISVTTTYDPERNQIVRNVDCLLHEAGHTQPVFWMLTRDAGAGRMYTQLIREYRRDPDLLHKQLPHADPDKVSGVARNMAIVLWKDLIKIPPSAIDLDSVSGRVHRELLIRVT